MLKYEVPAVYEIIMQMTPKREFPEPTVRTIEIICQASADKSLKKPKFFRYLEEYRKKGICCNRPKVLTYKRERFYAAMLKKKHSRYIQSNRELVRKLRTKTIQKHTKA